MNSKTVAQEQFWIYLRIFVLMGVSWLSEAVHVEVHGNHDHDCGAVAEVSIELISINTIVYVYYISNKVNLYPLQTDKSFLKRCLGRGTNLVVFV